MRLDEDMPLPGKAAIEKVVQTIDGGAVIPPMTSEERQALEDKALEQRKPFDHRPIPIDQDSSTTVQAPEPSLSPQQSRILETILSGSSCFSTGSAGTGKSV